MSRKLNALVCIAHPDDETIFFGGLILSKKYNWTVACVTNANADGHGRARMLQFHKSCRKLGIKKIVHFSYEDKFRKRLPVDYLIPELSALGQFDVVYTHGILGEYGHVQHQDVSYAVHQAFNSTSKVYSVAYNIYPQIQVRLTARHFKIKTDILWKIYSGESMRFLNLLPATSSEGFCQVSLAEVEELYQFARRLKKLNAKKLKVYSWLTGYIQHRDFELKFRPF